MYAAGDGEKGGSNGCTGKNGEDRLIPVPLGTVVYDKDTGEKICEVLDDSEVLIAKGGKRGAWKYPICIVKTSSARRTYSGWRRHRTLYWAETKVDC